MKEETQWLLDYLDCEVEVFEYLQDAKVLLDRYQELQLQGEQEGFTPLIITPDEVLVEHLEMTLEEEGLEATPEEIRRYREGILDSAAKLNGGAWLEEHRWQAEEGVEADEDEVEEMNHFSSFLELDSEQPVAEILLARIPTRNPYELAAWIPMGGFNDCPQPEEMVAVFRYWYEKYGAQPAAVTYDVWECHVKQPPAEEQTALLLAEEQAGFCVDIVDQGVGTVEALATVLKNSSLWYFWWD